MASVRPRAVIPEAAQRLSGTHGAGVWAWIPARRCASRPGSSLPEGEGRLGAQAPSGVGIAGRRNGPSMKSLDHGRAGFNQEPYARRSPPRSGFARVGPPLRGGRGAALLSRGVVPEAALGSGLRPAQGQAPRLSGTHGAGVWAWIPALRCASAGMTAVGEDGE